MTGRLEGKVALITGAGSGMGRAAAELFASEGARVVVTDVDRRRRATTTVAAVRAAGGDATFVRANVAEWADCEAMVRAAIDTYGGAARALQQRRHLPRRRRRRARHARGDVATGDGDQPRRRVARLPGRDPGDARVGRRQRSSTSRRSSRSMGAATAQIAYTASKGGVLSMTREIAVEYARQGIRANALCPGPIQTPLLEELLSDPDRRARRMVHIPMGRLGRAEELAKAALFLASDDASFMTGAVARRRRRHHRRVRHSRVTRHSARYDARMTTVPGMLTAAELAEEIDERRDRHRARRVPRPPGPARRQARHRPLLGRADAAAAPSPCTCATTCSRSTST